MSSPGAIKFEFVLMMTCIRAIRIVKVICEKSITVVAKQHNR
jgi:hypothetical protein